MSRNLFIYKIMERHYSNIVFCFTFVNVNKYTDYF